MKTQIVAIDTEISILSDQIIAAKREFGDKTFDLMANLEANQAQISAYYDVRIACVPLPFSFGG